MKQDKRTISIKAARLIIRYLHNSLSPSEQRTLDKWVCLSHRNMEIFEQLTENVDDNVLNTDDLLLEEEF